MSTRALRKLHSASLPGNDTRVDSESDKEEEHRPSPRVNVFEFLGDQGDDDSEYVAEDTPVSLIPQTAATKSSLSGKKKKKKKQKVQANVPVDDCDLDEIDQCLKEVEQMPMPTKLYVAREESRSKSLLEVEYRNLNPENELKRIFGSGIFEESANNNRRRGNRGVVRKGLLVQPKVSWPPVVKLGVSMLDTGGGTYCVEHSRDYQRTQLMFLEAVETGMPEALTSLLRQHPYHTDTLLQLAEVFRIQEDVSQAADLIERVIYAYECSFCATFNVTLGSCRLSYTQKENRGFFIALLRQAMFLSARCCNRTSLEVCKLLLSLSPTADPLGVLLLIDLPCLMSGEEKYLINLFHAWESTRQLSQLPNWAYSTALAIFRQGDVNEADRVLEDALLLFPAVLIPLLDKLSVKAEKQITECPYFISMGRESVGVKHLSALYVHRSGHCWKQPEALDFLMSCALRVAQLPSNDARIVDYSNRRRRRYAKPPINVWRHLVLSDVRETLTGFPPEINPAEFSAVDPLPPADSVCAYSAELERRRRARTAAGAETSVLSAFLRSIHPNFDPSAAALPDNAEGPVLGERLAALRAAVQDILNNFGPPQLPTDEDPQE